MHKPPKILLNAHVYSWGTLPHGYDALTPLKPAQIAKLGDALDECAGRPDWSLERQDAEVMYQAALRDRMWHLLRKFEFSKQTPKHKEAKRLNAEIDDAQFELDMAITARELLDARAALELARGRHKISTLKYFAARRLAEADERAGKNLVMLRGVTYRRPRQ
ncbi:hypothetical protein G6321_00050305 [Bradyrhizobium barranii subsp. barranii]|uniref:Uncharacterized protein n=1 Tax=Bradyrhizobium barranii subsp. barranii TaxID=2823807 RepID=A0A7Z0QBJ8_9BRAD|nr:hypothetical protein [Bradyrhizobium barranii]UGX93689.1 hypothetical protein G6321_00050305 [Bradyrhizobium barranii subsp. barranii]